MNALNSTVSQKIRILSSRAVVYKTLARAFGPNVAVFSTKTFSKDLRRAIKALSNFNLEKELVAVRKALNEITLKSDMLTAEHTHLFTKGVCPPYETSYDVERSTVKTHDLADVAGFYAAFGVKPKGELPDHIVSELEFMSLLCLKEAYALAHGTQAKAEICAQTQRKFIEDHLGKWLFPLNKCVRENARLPIYPAFLDLTYRFVMLDASYLGVNLFKSAEE